MKHNVNFKSFSCFIIHLFLQRIAREKKYSLFWQIPLILQSMNFFIQYLDYHMICKIKCIFTNVFVKMNNLETKSTCFNFPKMNKYLQFYFAFLFVLIAKIVRYFEHKVWLCYWKEIQHFLRETWNWSITFLKNRNNY